MPSSASIRTRDFREIPPPEREYDVLREAMFVLGERLPDSWSLRTREKLPSTDRGIDQVTDLRAPDGDSLTLLIEVKRSIAPRDVLPILDQLRGFVSPRAKNPALPVLVARYLPETTR